MWKEAFVAKFEAVSHLSGVTVESNETVPSEQPVSGTVSEVGSSQIQRCAIHSTAMTEWMRKKHEVLEIIIKFLGITITIICLDDFYRIKGGIYQLYCVSFSDQRKNFPLRNIVVLLMAAALHYLTATSILIPSPRLRPQTFSAILTKTEDCNGTNGVDLIPIDYRPKSL
jgi:hypothetical protein